MAEDRNDEVSRDDHIATCDTGKRQARATVNSELMVQDRHPEADCHLCGGPNIAWSAPSPLWNAVMRGGSINGEELHDGIVCPVCFATLAEAAGIADLWKFSAKRVHVDLETVTPSGRVWDEVTWMWREPDQAEPPVDALAELKGLRDRAYERAVAEGRRQATGGWERHWGVANEHEVHPAINQADAEEWSLLPGWGHVVSRFVGPWEPVEQPEQPRTGFVHPLLHVNYADNLDGLPDD